MAITSNVDADRFGGIARLLGTERAARLAASTVAVVGLGGVGSWTVEALARSGVGRLILVDLDDVCVTNTNRQLQALAETVGRPKVDVLTERIAQINPACDVKPVPAFVSESNVGELLPSPLDALADCIDRGRVKAAMIAYCRANDIAVVSSGATAGRLDPTQLEVTDLAEATGDALLARTRRHLRSVHGFPRAGRPMGVGCVTSRETPTYPWTDGSCRTSPEPASETTMDCSSGPGSASFVTGTAGLILAAEIVRLVCSSMPAGGAR